jgi:hypothetical protein
MDLTLTNLPAVWVQRLQTVANLRGCSVNDLIVFSLAQTFGGAPTDRSVLLDRIRRRRDAQTLWFEHAALALDDGRAGD